MTRIVGIKFVETLQLKTAVSFHEKHQILIAIKING